MLQNEFANSAFINYELSRDKIAAWPVGAEGRVGKNRTDSKLIYSSLAADGSSTTLTDLFFRDLPQILREGDLLVLNDSRVVPVRFFARRVTGAEVEVLLIRKAAEEELREKHGEEHGEKPEKPLATIHGTELWQALAKPMRRLKAGETIRLGKKLQARVGNRVAEGRRILLGLFSESSKSVAELISEEGLAPIPPYIRSGRSEPQDRGLYQTVYARKPGSIAAPTAGLHFSDELLSQLEARGIQLSFLTLHVGPASFIPVDCDNPEEFKVDTEYYSIPKGLFELISQKKRGGGRIVAVGTTVVRALESEALRLLEHERGELALRPGGENFWSGGENFSPTRLFIKPGFKFRVVDTLITNFHQPSSTHLFLVNAFIGNKNTEKIYTHALKNDYRFLSYGDAMLLEKCS